MEKQIIDWLSANIPRGDNVSVGIGDDAAVVDCDSPAIVVTTDALVDGTHFRCEEHSAARIGYKSLAVSLSDLAAMGALPSSCVVSLVLPHSVDLTFVKELYGGMLVLCNQYDFSIIGGDTNFADGPLMISVTAIGSAFRKIWHIDGAASGDHILVSGDFGGSILDKHLDFVPRLDLVKMLSPYQIAAATDVSDGLIADLNHVLHSSGCGAELDVQNIPISKAAKQLASLDDSVAMDHALYDGEDFELIVIAKPSVANRILSKKKIGKQLSMIGTVIGEPGIFASRQGQRVEIEVKGFEHS